MRVLVIEDEPKMADLLKRGLEEEGFHADVAYDGDNGLRAGKENKFELIILDVTLPGLDGFAVARELRAANIKNTNFNADRARLDGNESAGIGQWRG